VTVSSGAGEVLVNKEDGTLGNNFINQHYAAATGGAQPACPRDTSACSDSRRLCSRRS
jgi:hypothetical protein